MYGSTLKIKIITQQIWLFSGRFHKPFLLILIGIYAVLIWKEVTSGDGDHEEQEVSVDAGS
jgi:hypothetical protein